MMLNLMLASALEPVGDRSGVSVLSGALAMLCITVSKIFATLDDRVFPNQDDTSWGRFILRITGWVLQGVILLGSTVGAIVLSFVTGHLNFGAVMLGWVLSHAHSWTWMWLLRDVLKFAYRYRKQRKQAENDPESVSAQVSYEELMQFNEGVDIDSKRLVKQQELEMAAAKSSQLTSGSALSPGPNLPSIVVSSAADALPPHQGGAQPGFPQVNPIPGAMAAQHGHAPTQHAPQAVYAPPARRGRG